MDVLKKIFPLSFKYTKDASNLVIGILIYLIAGLIIGALIVLATMLVGWIPAVGAVIGWILGTISGLLGLYVLAGIVILILAFTKVLK